MRTIKQNTGQHKEYLATRPTTHHRVGDKSPVSVYTKPLDRQARNGISRMRKSKMVVTKHRNNN